MRRNPRVVPIDLNESTQHTAVLLIDMQTPFVRNIREGRKEITIRKQIEVIRICAKKNIPLIVLEYNDEGPTITALRDELQHVPRVFIITKHSDSGFRGTSLKKKLKKLLNVKSLLLMGINARCCVKETAHGALEAGFSIATSPELISGPSWHGDYDGIEWYKKNGAIVEV